MKCKLEEICSFRRGKTDVANLTTETYISTENMLPNKSGIVNATSLPIVDLTQAYENGDVLVSNIRPYFKKIWKAKINGGCSNDVLVFTAKENTDSDFLYYVLADDAFFAYAMATSKGTKMPRGDRKSIMQYEVPCYDIETQQKIASILKSIDEKIELNNAINNNLEQQASLLVRQYCENLTSSVEVGTILSFENGFAFKSSSYHKKGKYRIITIKNVQDAQIDTQGAACIDDIPPRMKQNCFLSIGDVLISLTGNVGRVGIVCEKNLLLNQRVAKFVPKDIRMLPLIYFYFRLPSTKTSLEVISKGTAQQNLSPIEALKLQIPYETQQSLESSNLLHPMFCTIYQKNIENIQLAEIRNSLLPRLMSGELDVSDIDI
ncbi:restriction endonuclease subunit S [Filifactor alocis]|uniref:restriction endonuclease subunit S n=1 Tax=Filifactor alocis TaxID=143361 RepID=UPI003C6F3EB4